MSVNDKLRFGIIGCGQNARNKHMKSLSRTDNVEIAGFSDVFEEKAEEARKGFGCSGSKVYTDYRNMLEDKTIDVIHIATHNRLHATISVEAMEAGKHVMCEKPMALNAVECEEMLKVSKNTGKKLTIGYQNRFKSEFLHLKRLCEKGVLGDIYFAEVYFCSNGGGPGRGLFYKKEEQGGGPLVDLGSHALDMAMWLMGNYKVESVSGKTFYGMMEKDNKYPDIKNISVEDSGFAQINMENGALIILKASWRLNIIKKGYPGIEISGTKMGANVIGEFMLTGMNEQGEWSRTVEKDEMNEGSPFDVDDDQSLRQVKQWVKCIRNNTDPLVKPEEALMVTKVLDAAYKSADTGKTVYL